MFTSNMLLSFLTCSKFQLADSTNKSSLLASLHNRFLEFPLYPGIHQHRSGPHLLGACPCSNRCYTTMALNNFRISIIYDRYPVSQSEDGSSKIGDHTQIAVGSNHINIFPRELLIHFKVCQTPLKYRINLTTTNSTVCFSRSLFMA